MTQTTNEFEEKAYQLVSKALGCTIDSLSPLSGIYDHPDWDSFGHLQIILEIEHHFGLEITDEDVLKFASIEEIINLHRRQQKN